ncbi:MAG TPA: helicase HerA-like domain-containing protein [Ignavibacteriaceae bacterium]|nr:helicase HerA-like domain-containing protein [Ignavibacteriaceae bacterium]
MIDSSGNLLIAKSDKELFLIPKMSNRHGLIAGATGTGKTVTLQSMAESFSSIGVPIIMADVKGDLSGVAKQAGENPKINERLKEMNLQGYKPQGFPVCFWDIFGQQGHPLRTTISEMGPLLLSRLLNLNDVQAGVMTLVFKIADDNNLLLLDMKDLKKMLEFIGEHRDEYINQYGNISSASIGSIQRGLLVLEEQGAEKFFGEPAADIMDFIQTDVTGKGVINIIASDKLMMYPGLYSTFLLWLLSELFEKLPEVGDLEKPKLIFFFDEAHLLFNDAPKVLLEKIEQVVRLVRSKGVGVFFVTQNPIDIPDTVLGQLGNRVQHALRAFTPKDQKAVRSAAETFRSNPGFKVEEIITELGVGTALVSLLDEKGIPGMVEMAKIVPPQSQIGPITTDERTAILRSSVINGVYEKIIDRESAYEILGKRFAQENAEKQQLDELTKKAKQERLQRTAGSSSGGVMGDLAKTMGRTITRQVGNELGRTIVRGVLGTILTGALGTILKKK